MPNLSRRDFLKLSGLALGGLAFSRLPTGLTSYDDITLVRVATDAISVHSRPDDTSRIISQWYRDDIVHVYEEVDSGTPGYNPIWYRVWGGYMHRAYLQKVKYTFNTPIVNLPEAGRQLGEITVPFSEAKRFSSYKGWYTAYRLYYGSVHWIIDILEGLDGEPWYRLLDELGGITYDLPASHVRPISPEEISPISPEVPHESKHIEISLARQVLTAHEYDKVVFETFISSGIPSSTPGTNGIPTITPSGRFNVGVKMPSKHMGNGNLAADIHDYVLPGVPWCSFFTVQGHAIHGAWWHDNFSVPMSHGCINMRPEEAKWVYRWALPITEPADIDHKGRGTEIIIT
jgi:hypothetical protein